MSYAGPSSRPNRAPDFEPTEGESPRSREPQTRMVPWSKGGSDGRRQTAVFAAGVVLGLTIGAGVALLFAPESGAYTRRALVRRGRRVTLRSRDAWDDLRDEFSNAVRNRKRAWRRRRNGRETRVGSE